jgi:hypothetical protein
MKLNNAILFGAVLVSANSYAYDDHASWSSSRGNYYGSYQYITETEGWQSTATLLSKDQFGRETQTTTPYKGLGFRAGLGVELAKFVRFSAYSASRDLTNSTSDSLRSYQLGGETAVSFYGPVLNIQFGIGLFASRQLQQKPNDGRTYLGSGFTGSVGFERFISQKASMIFSIRSQQESLRPDDKDSKDKLLINSTGASLALSLWM